MTRKLIFGLLASLGTLAVLSASAFQLSSESAIIRSVNATGPVCGIWNLIANKPSGLFQGKARLLGIAAIANDNIWGVGVERAALTSEQALILHWTGTKWEKADLPQLGPNSGLADVFAINDRNIWAVGGKDGSTLVLHWDGQMWTEIPSPNGINITGNDLRGISAISPTDIWAVGNSLGSPLTIHWNGNKWSTIPTPKPDGLGNALNAVTGVNSSNVWAVGYQGYGSFQALIMHWNGYQWTIVVAPSIPQQSGDANEGQVLASVKAFDTNNIWAVGWTKYFTMSRTLIEHWDGAAWHIVPSPNSSLGSSMLLGLIAVSRDDIWAVGEASRSYGDAEEVLVEHWDGSRWQIISGPKLFGSQGFRNGVTVANGVLWIAGEADRQAMIAAFFPTMSACGREAVR